MTKMYRCMDEIDSAVRRIMSKYVGSAKAEEISNYDDRLIDAMATLEGCMMEAVNYTVVKDSVVRELEDFGFDYDDGIIDRIMEERSPEWEWS